MAWVPDRLRAKEETVTLTSGLGCSVVMVGGRHEEAAVSVPSPAHTPDSSCWQISAYLTLPSSPAIYLLQGKFVDGRKGTLHVYVDSGLRR